MAGLCEGGNEPPGSLKASIVIHCLVPSIDSAAYLPVPTESATKAPVRLLQLLRIKVISIKVAILYHAASYIDLKTMFLYFSTYCPPELRHLSYYEIDREVQTAVKRWFRSQTADFYDTRI
ncbi:hypothetical protein ANN_06006 [Periplaneta americana]|uniref:Uncharacterized protein n=1 Tax=Periplaneta americana TaxID=6978 RepID=A0ABQ8TED4_PERAM|nr:hypothetical protein ANN_06006 [Periplaneta americana]